MDYHALIKTYPQLFKNPKDKLAIEIVTDPKIIKNWQKKRLKELSKNKQPLSWADIGVILDDPYYIVIRDLVKFPNGRMNGYNRILARADLAGGQAVVVLPVYKDKILIMRQYRHPVRSWEYEIPRGYGEPDVSPSIQARREIQEEIGGKIRKLHRLGVVKENTGSVGSPVLLFMAELSTYGKPNEDENIEKLIWLSVKEFEEWIACGKISDGYTISAYTRAKLKNFL